MKTDNSYFWKGGRVQIFGNNLKSRNSIQKENKNIFKSGNACYHSVQNILSSSLLSKIIKINIYRTIILPVFLYVVKVGHSR